MDLTIQQLRVIVAVGRTGSFTAASEELHLVQSSMSRAVAEVERRVGVTLFDRSTRRVVPTAEGREFIAVAQRVVASFDTGMNHFTGFLRGQKGRVKISTLPSLAATLLPPIVATFRRQHPEVEIHIEDALLGEAVARVRSGQVDFAVTIGGGSLEGLRFIPVASDEFCCVFPASHRFSEASTLDWSDLEGEPFIAFDRASSVRLHVDRATAAAAIQFGQITEARNVAAVAGLVAAGLGVTAVPSLVIPLIEFARLERRPLLEPRVTRAVGIALDPHRPLSPACRAFVESVVAARESGQTLPVGARWETTKA